MNQIAICFVLGFVAGMVVTIICQKLRKRQIEQDRKRQFRTFTL